MNKSTATYHKAILNFLIDYKKTNQSSLTFYLRKSNKPNREKTEYFFHGNDEYISIPFYKQSGGFNHTQSIGFNFWMKSTDEPLLEIVHNASVDPNHLPLYREIVIALQKIKGWRKVSSTANRTRFYYQKQRWTKNLTLFLKDHKPVIDRLIKVRQLGNDFFVKNVDLNEALIALEL